jgi:hypothetical protein
MLLDTPLMANWRSLRCSQDSQIDKPYKPIHSWLPPSRFPVMQLFHERHKLPIVLLKALTRVRPLSPDQLNIDYTALAL